MAEFGSGLCRLTEYKKAFDERLRAGGISDAEILTLYLRLEKRDVAYRLQPVQVKVRAQNAAVLAIDVFLVDEDLKPIQNKMSSGIMVDGVWNTPGDDGSFYCPDANNRPVRSYDGVFRDYDDGVDM